MNIVMEKRSEHGVITPSDLLGDNAQIAGRCACGNTFVAPACFARVLKKCQACSDKLIAAEERRRALEAEQERADRWARLCPAEYRSTDPAKLPLPNLAERVLAWTYGPRGLLLHGLTGKGKSRCAWLLLKREHEAGRRIKMLDHSAGFDYGKAFSESMGKAAEWVERLQSVPLLFLDDVFKCKLTDSLEQAIFTVVATRCESGLPTIVTTNDTGKSLVDRMSADRGDALIRRLVEHTEQIAFT